MSLNASELVIFVSALLWYSSSTVKTLNPQYKRDCVKHMVKVLQTFIDQWSAVKSSFGLYMKYYQNYLYVGLIFVANFFMHYFLECNNLSNRPPYLCVLVKLNLLCMWWLARYNINSLALKFLALPERNKVSYPLLDIRKTPHLIKTKSCITA